MKLFIQTLERAIEEEFGDSHRTLGLKAKVNHSHISRIIAGDRGVAPEIAGKLADACSKPMRERLLTIYLQAVAEKTKCDVTVSVTFE